MVLNQLMKNLVGERYGKLVVVAFDGRDGRRYYWKCRCDCGQLTRTRADGLGKKANSCGHCNGKMGGTPLHYVWHAMRARCTNPKTNRFKHYGGRGIRVCDEWSDFPTFYRWAKANGYRKGLSIDRRDNDGNYEPSNCRWAKDAVQRMNRQNTIWIEHNGERKTLCDWAKHFGIKYGTLFYRVKKYGWKGDRIFSPVGAQC